MVPTPDPAAEDAQLARYVAAVRADHPNVTVAIVTGGWPWGTTAIAYRGRAATLRRVSEARLEAGIAAMARALADDPATDVASDDPDPDAACPDCGALPGNVACDCDCHLTIYPTQREGA